MAGNPEKGDPYYNKNLTLKKAIVLCGQQMNKEEILMAQEIIEAVRDRFSLADKNKYIIQGNLPKTVK